jgi:hypothetical protein
MRIEKGTSVRLKSFLGALVTPKGTYSYDNYWKLIGQKGKVIDDNEINEGRILVLFEKNIDDFNLANHNPLKNSLWIKKTDLEEDNS